MVIAGAKDLDVLMARLKGDSGDVMLQAIDDDREISSSTVSTQDNTTNLIDSGFLTPATQSKKTDGKDDLKAKVFKQHMELQKLKEFLELAEKEQQDLKNEVRARN